MECVEDKECVMHADGGNDEIDQQRYSKNVYITDFDKKDDKIILHYRGYSAGIGHPNNTEESFYNSGKLNAVILQSARKW